MESATTRAAMPPAEVHSVPTSDGAEVKLTRYRFGDKGPLVLAPGYGNAAHAFAIETVDQNWVQYLGEHGYDVWLFDYRASPELAASHTQFTVDDIAMRDWPAAIETVRRESGQDSVQAMGHCVGGLSLFMAIGGGMEGLRSATFSSLAGNPIPTPGNQARAWARMATLLKRLGVQRLDVEYEPSRWDGKAIETVMKALPFRHVPDNPVARRIYFVYGDVYDYENINDDTMNDAVPAFFGGGNMTFFEHISLMIRASAARDARGQDAYWANLDNFKFPINFITGEHNKMFVPKGLQRSYDTLRRAHGPGDYSHAVIPNYAHLDLWLGENASRDVWPTALAELEKHN
jgi:pimeloyl-ACP methyl ester carboxylesterase